MCSLNGITPPKREPVNEWGRNQLGHASQLVAMWLGEGAAIVKRGEHGEEGGGGEVVADVQ